MMDMLSRSGASSCPWNLDMILQARTISPCDSSTPRKPFRSEGVRPNTQRKGAKDRKARGGNKQRRIRTLPNLPVFSPRPIPKYDGHVEPLRRILMSVEPRHDTASENDLTVRLKHAEEALQIGRSKTQYSAQRRKGPQSTRR